MEVRLLGVCGVGFAAWSLAGIVQRRSRIEVSSNKELVEDRKVAECYRGRIGEQITARGVRQGNMMGFSKDMFQNMETMMVGGD